MRKSLKEYNHVIFGASVGFGKSICIYDFCARYLEKGKRVLVLAPRRELVSQLTETLKNLKPFTVINSQRVGDYKSNLVISSKQTTNIQIKKCNPVYNDFDLIIIDEVHITTTVPPKPNSEFEALYNKYWNTNTKFIGFSGTPITARGYRLEGWDKVVYEYETAKLIEMQYLANYTYLAPEEIDLTQLHVSSTGEYIAEDVEKMTNTAVAVASVKKQWVKYTKKNKVILIFASSIYHAQLLHDEFKGSGIIHSKMTDAEQKKVLLDFKDGVINTLINVRMLSTGYNNDKIDCLILATPIKSVATFIQVCGRALRKDGDKHTTILDLTSCYQNCGTPRDKRDWNKKYIPRKKMKMDDGVEKVTKCPSCKEVFPSIEMKIKRKVKKSFTLTKKWCPICKALIDEVRVDLTKVDKLVEIEETIIKEYTNQERYKIICDLITEHTTARRSWGKHILKDIIEKDNLELLDQILSKTTKSKTKWTNLMKLKD